MDYSLLMEINKQTLDAYLSKREYEPHYWPKFFPLKPTPFLTYETLIGSKGLPVAADVVSYDSSAPLKTRAVVGKLAGTIEPIRIKRKMTETDLNTYNVLKAMKRPEHQAILDLVFADVDFVVDGVNARLEFLCMRALYQQTILLTVDNNAGIITKSAIDFQLEAAHKRVIKNTNSNRTWKVTNKANALPITDIRVVKKAAKDAGIVLNFILMNVDKFEEFAMCAQVVDFCLPYTAYAAVKGTISAPQPSLDSVNKAMKDHSLPQIITIDTQIRVEKEDHSIVTVYPFQGDDGTSKNVVFLQTLSCGNVLHGPMAEETNPPKNVTQSKKGPVLVTKYSDVDPVAEYTKGELNAFPTWPTIDTVWRLDTETTGNATGIET